MRFGISYSSDPIYMDPFLLNILKDNLGSVVCVMKTNGSLTKKKSSFLKRLNYFLTLLIALGVFTFLKIILIKALYLFKKNPLKIYCLKNQINYMECETINSEKSKKWLLEQSLDIVFNQSQHIVKKEIIDIPRIGMINRHGSLLPKYRGLLSPFWHLKNNENTGGVSFHFLNAKIDDGKIIWQKKIPINKNETLNSLIKKIFIEARTGFKEVITIVSKKNYKNYLIDNNNESSYYKSPTLKDAFEYRFK